MSSGWPTVIECIKLVTENRSEFTTPDPSVSLMVDVISLDSLPNPTEWDFMWYCPTQVMGNGFQFPSHVLGPWCHGVCSFYYTPRWRSSLKVRLSTVKEIIWSHHSISVGPIAGWVIASLMMLRMSFVFHGHSVYRGLFLFNFGSALLL